MNFCSLLLKLLLLTFPSSLNDGDDEPPSDWILLRSPGPFPNKSKIPIIHFCNKESRKEMKEKQKKFVSEKKKNIASWQKDVKSSTPRRLFLLSKKRNGTHEWHANVTETPRERKKKANSTGRNEEWHVTLMWRIWWTRETHQDQCSTAFEFFTVIFKPVIAIVLCVGCSTFTRSINRENEKT